MADDRSDREEISDVLIRYATGIDTKDWALFRTCFTDEVHADYGEIGAWTGVDQITEYMSVTHASMPRTNHMVSNFAIDVDGDAASVTSYVHVVLVVSEDPFTWIDGVGQYADRFVRTSDGWRIRERRYTMTRLISSEGSISS